MVALLVDIVGCGKKKKLGDFPKGLCYWYDSRIGSRNLIRVVHDAGVPGLRCEGGCALGVVVSGKLVHINGGDVRRIDGGPEGPGVNSRRWYYPPNPSLSVKGVEKNSQAYGSIL